MAGIVWGELWELERLSNMGIQGPCEMVCSGGMSRAIVEMDQPHCVPPQVFLSSDLQTFSPHGV